MGIQSSQVQFKETIEILIVVRGQRTTGKSSMIEFLRTNKFNSDYSPTSQLVESEIRIFHEHDNVKINIWDCPEKAIPSFTEVLPDASNVDTISEADALVLFIDSRYSDTFSIAAKIVQSAPPDLPIFLYSNFQDLPETQPNLPLIFENCKLSFFAGSVKHGDGVDILKKWINLPILYHRKKQHFSLYQMFEKNLISALEVFSKESQKFLNPDEAMKKFPKRVEKDPFWDREEQPEPAKQIQQTNAAVNQHSDSDDEALKPNPLVQIKGKSLLNIQPIDKPKNSHPSIAPASTTKTVQQRDAFFDDDSFFEKEIVKPNPLVQPNKNLIKTKEKTQIDSFFSDEDENQNKENEEVIEVKKQQLDELSSPPIEIFSLNSTLQAAETSNNRDGYETDFGETTQEAQSKKKRKKHHSHK